MYNRVGSPHHWHRGSESKCLNNNIKYNDQEHGDPCLQPPEQTHSLLSAWYTHCQFQPPPSFTADRPAVLAFEPTPISGLLVKAYS